jgi:hypothetical protein
MMGVAWIPQPIKPPGLCRSCKCRYASSSLALEVDTFVDEGPRSLPMHDSDFSDSTPTSLDFAAMAIQQGRDRGLPDYNTMREAYGLRKHTYVSIGKISRLPCSVHIPQGDVSLQCAFGKLFSLHSKMPTSKCAHVYMQRLQHDIYQPPHGGKTA